MEERSESSRRNLKRTDGRHLGTKKLFGGKCKMRAGWWAVSTTNTHLGHNLPDKNGNRYCINLVSVAAMLPK